MRMGASWDGMGQGLFDTWLPLLGWIAAAVALWLAFRSLWHRD